MVSFSSLDIGIIVFFFAAVIIIGLIPKKESAGDSAGYLLSGRKVGLFLFILTNVATWYGGILGVGEFTYRYGLVSWFTQGLPYYIFAIIFAFTFADKIRDASLYTIPDKLEQTYGKTVGIISSFIVFILVSPAPYILMAGSLIHLIFGLNLFISLIIAAVLSSVYMIKGGFTSNLYTDAIQFFVMFTGFILIVLVSVSDVGGITFLKQNLPESHLSLTGNASPVYIAVWFFIAMWTFADPGFHQRCYAAKNGKTAKYGIIISVFLWALFDFLTTTTGLFARAELPNLNNPVLSFPIYAEKILSSGTKGIFYAALFATIMSTSNSFLFLGATTFGRDFISKLKKGTDESKLPIYTRWGLLVSSIIAVLLAFFIQSVISLWYLIGSICIPGIILLIFGAYHNRLRIPNSYAVAEIIFGVSFSLIWVFARLYLTNSWLGEIEPMIIGLVFVGIIHLLGIRQFKRKVFS